MSIGTEWYFKALDSLPFSSCAIDMQSQVELEGWKAGINTVTKCVKAGSACISKNINA